jgi:hypothetical protein
MDSEGSERLILAASAAGAHVRRGQKLPLESCEQSRQRNAALDLKQYLRPGYQGPWWTAEDLALLGKMPDELVAAYVGRMPAAVRWQRTASPARAIGGGGRTGPERWPGLPQEWPRDRTGLRRKRPCGASKAMSRPVTLHGRQLRRYYGGLRRPSP